jgi:hypothetical protein
VLGARVRLELQYYPYFQIWVSHMKTTIDISDVLFDRARAAAKAQGTTLRALIEAGLTKVLASSEAPPKRRKMRDLSFGGAPNSMDIPVEQLRSNRDYIVVDGELVKVYT